MIRLHHCHDTRSMRILWLLHELEVPFELIIHPFDQSLRSPEYLTLSPAGRVPALEIEGERMFETGAIAQYLCERFPEAGMGRAPELPDRMAWLTWLHFAETVSQHVAALTQQHLVLREDHMRSPYVMKLEAARLGKCFDAIETRLSPPLEGRDYLLTSGFSAADVAVGQAVHMGRHFVSLQGYPEVTAWYARLCEREAFQRALPEPEERLFTQEFYAAWPV